MSLIVTVKTCLAETHFISQDATSSGTVLLKTCPCKKLLLERKKLRDDIRRLRMRWKRALHAKFFVIFRLFELIESLGPAAQDREDAERPMLGANKGSPVWVTHASTSDNYWRHQSLKDSPPLVVALNSSRAFSTATISRRGGLHDAQQLRIELKSGRPMQVLESYNTAL